MLCGKCKKNQATKSYEQIKNGKKSLEYYCLDCYHRLFLDVGESTGTTVCPYCGVTADEVKRRNIVGCAMCYESLKDALYPIVTKLQGGQKHKGKKPVGDKSEDIRRRCYELRAIADKLNAEGDFDGARAYVECLVKLQRGEEEEYVWRKHPLLYKRS
ncbi:MAG: hypothetical protein IJX88_03230 [Clostridia bacterium]|nr:hypothetical protein [Clostridia bacterium]